MGPLRVEFPNMTVTAVIRVQQRVSFAVEYPADGGVVIEFLGGVIASTYEAVQVGNNGIVIRLKNHPADVITACPTCGAPVL